MNRSHYFLFFCLPTGVQSLATSLNAALKVTNSSSHHTALFNQLVSILLDFVQVAHGKVNLGISWQELKDIDLGGLQLLIEALFILASHLLSVFLVQNDFIQYDPMVPAFWH